MVTVECGSKPFSTDWTLVKLRISKPDPVKQHNGQCHLCND